jgi:hypothetical protein
MPALADRITATPARRPEGGLFRQFRHRGERAGAAHRPHAHGAKRTPSCWIGPITATPAAWSTSAPTSSSARAAILSPISCRWRPFPILTAARTGGRTAARPMLPTSTSALDAVQARTGDGPATFIAESVSGVGGQVVLSCGLSAGRLCAASAPAGGLVHRGRGAMRIWPGWYGLLGVRVAGRHPRHCRAGQADRQRPPPWRWS